MAVKLIPMEAKAPRDGVAFRSLIPKPEDIGHAGWITIIAPIVVASPGYFGGELSFGALMMVVGASIQVQQALRWFIDNSRWRFR